MVRGSGFKRVCDKQREWEAEVQVAFHLPASQALSAKLQYGASLSRRTGRQR